MNKKQGNIIIGLVLLIIMILTNPTESDFNDYCIKNSVSLGTVYWKKESLNNRKNYFFYSKYEASHSGGAMLSGAGTNREETYLGIFGTFFKVSEE